MTKDEAFLMAIEALDNADYHRADEAITAIKAALEAKDEPVACSVCSEWEKVCDQHLRYINKLKKKRTWVGLIEEDLKPLCDEWRIVYGAWAEDFARAIEAKLRSKND